MSSLRLNRPGAALLAIDLQERLLPAIHEAQRVLANSVRLLRGAAALGVPVLATEQYPKGLGPTVPAVTAALAGVRPLEKVTFSACGAPGLTETLRAKAVRDLLLCGVETHVCVCQTALDLLEAGFRVFLAVDACSSRIAENHQIGLRRLERAGAVLVSTEMALFELLGRAGTEEFKKILELVK